jgi:hypothetical protein
MPILATRHLGHCQICEGEFKLHEGNMVHHGYRRPGYGNIVGDCYGVNNLPYEKSCELVKEYVFGVRAHLDDTTNWLQQLRSGLVIELWVTPWRSEAVLVKKSEKTEYEWSNLLNLRISETEHRVTSLTREVERLENRIETWKLTETRTVEEAVEQEKQAKAERKAIRDAAREVKEAKLRATRERQKAIQDRKDATKAEIISKAKELAAVTNHTEEHFKAVEKLRKAMRKATWLWFNDYQECRPELTKLGLMSSDGTLRI